MLASGLEPDECYIIGADQRAERPDLAIEVQWTSGGIDKLEIYRRLGVPEVWVWREGALEVYVLNAAAYERASESVQLPGIDVPLLTSLLDNRTYPTAMQAVRAFLAAMSG